jgi:hypothetical protein
MMWVGSYSTAPDISPRLEEYRHYVQRRKGIYGAVPGIVLRSLKLWSHK